MEREAWLLLVCLAVLGGAGTMLPAQGTRLSQWLSSLPTRRLLLVWGVSIAGAIATMLAASSVTGGHPPYPAIAVVAIGCLAAIHGATLTASLMRLGAGRWAAPGICLASFVVLAFLLIEVVPPAFVVQLSITGEPYHEDYTPIVLAFWPGALIATAASAVFAHRVSVKQPPLAE